MTDTPAPFIIGPEEVAKFAELRAKAAARPVYMPTLVGKLKSPLGRAAHRKRMTEQTVVVDRGPWPFFVTFSVETGHPDGGTYRHLSMSVARDGRVPHPAAMLMVMPHFGIVGGFDGCTIYKDTLSDGGTAINILQPVAMMAAAGSG